MTSIDNQSAKKLGRLVRQRRKALDMSQRDAASLARISDQTWLNVEAGRGASERKLAQVERALDWPSGTIDAILSGKSEGLTQLGDLLDLLAAQDLTSGEIEKVIAYVHHVLRRREAS